MIVEIEVQGQKVYLKWAKWKWAMFHIVRDIEEATIYSETQARKLKKYFAHKKAKLIRRKKD